MSTPEEIKAEYTSSLADLTFNSKPLINVLTMLAEENLPNARIIVEAIEEHLAKVAIDVKLPILYLIDCIVKNVGQTYTGLFSQNIVSTFCTVFKMVDEKTRLEMFKLRQTWNDVFPQMKLYAIDVHINQIDPAWPVTAQPSNSIHLNPKFLKNTPTTTKAKLPTTTTETAAPVVPAIPTKPAELDKETLLMQEQLIQKQKELLELQRKTLELEVLQTQVKLQEQMKAGGAAPPISTNILLKPEVAKQLIPEAMTKTRPMGISNATHHRQSHPKINPVNAALATARPITRDPRLLRQQQKLVGAQQKSQQQITSLTATSVPAQNTAVFENNKNITNKLGVRDIHKDPRLSSKIDKKSKDFPSKSRNQLSQISDLGPINQKSEKPRSDKSSDDSSFKSSSNSSLGSSSSSNLDSPTKKRSSKHKKRDKSDGKRSQEYDVSSSKREKKDDSSSRYSNASKNLNSENVSSFKSVKSKNRNYIRRNLDSPVPIQDQDLRSVASHPEKTNRLQQMAETTRAEQTSPDPDITITHSNLDIDLRQLPSAANKKRASTEASDQPSKKTRSFDVLFGSEDTDLRQMPAAPESEKKGGSTVGRPPTPPPPIISAEKGPGHLNDKPLPQSPKRSDFDAVRAKLANATSRDKIINKSFHKTKLNKANSTNQEQPTKGDAKITISPEEEKVIKSGNMTREQEKKILNKIFMQIEKDKLREAKIKDHQESFGDISLQTISDEELEPDAVSAPMQPHIEARPGGIPPPLMPFNDKDERLNIQHMQPQYMDTVPSGMDNNGPVPPFYPRGDRGRASFRGRGGWRGRGQNMSPQGPQPRQPIRPWAHQQQGPQRWRGSGAQNSYRPRPEFITIDDESSRSPGQDFASQEEMRGEENKTLNIDGIPRDIRVYNDIAIIFMNYDEPRQISFRDESRHRVIFNNKESYVLDFGDNYRECMVNGYPFRVKLGVPSRELFINDIGFECFFGGSPTHVTVNGISLMVALEGPPPQVKIGDEIRTDIVVGKINLIIDAIFMVPVFLDGKVQKFIVDDEPCTLKFVDALKRVLINDVPFKVEFGGLPKPFNIHGKKHFIRFSVLPKGAKPGFVKIKDMEGEGGVSPARDEEHSRDGFAGPLEAEPLRPDLSKVKNATGQESPDNRSNSPSFISNILQPALNNFDVISNALSLASAPATGGYTQEIPGLGPDKPAPEGATSQPEIKPPLNINELFQKLVASGFVKTQEKKEQPNLLPISTNVTALANNGKGNKQSHPMRPVHQEPPAKPQKRALVDILKPITFTRPETLKMRQAPLYTTLYTGMQCSSCGMRFPPEASMWYSQHLDWHFRQNRRGKKNARVASSRKWYYALADWKNYEELEDLEEREKNYFDQQQQAEVAEDAEEDTEIPTVPADPGSTDERCYVCRDAFEQFFNEEKEEWHLRNAIKMDDKSYHPVCYDDYQKSILEETLNESKTEDEPQNKLIPGLEIILDDDDDDDVPGMLDEVVSLADDDEELKVPEDAPSPLKDEDLPEDQEQEQPSPEEDGDDDDVILNEVAPIKIVVDDDDDDDLMETQNDDSQRIHFVKKEKKPAFDDGFIDVGEIVTLKGMGPVKIKSEPVDDDELRHPPSLDTSRVSESEDHQDGESHSELPTPESDIQPPTSQPQSITSHRHLVTSIDGNIELGSTVVPTTISSGTRIKINISKPLPVITPKENNESSDNSEVQRCESEMPAVEELEILSYKPALQNVPLKKLPPVQKGAELTGLCSIM